MIHEIRQSILSGNIEKLSNFNLENISISNLIYLSLKHNQIQICEYLLNYNKITLQDLMITWDDFYDIYNKRTKTETISYLIEKKLINKNNIYSIFSVVCGENNLEAIEFILQKKYIDSNFVEKCFFDSVRRGQVEVAEILNNHLPEISYESVKNVSHEVIITEQEWINSLTLESRIALLKQQFLFDQKNKNNNFRTLKLFAIVALLMYFPECLKVINIVISVPLSSIFSSFQIKATILFMGINLFFAITPYKYYKRITEENGSFLFYEIMFFFINLLMALSSLESKL